MYWGLVMVSCLSGNGQKGFAYFSLPFRTLNGAMSFFCRHIHPTGSTKSFWQRGRDITGADGSCDVAISLLIGGGEGRGGTKRLLVDRDGNKMRLLSTWLICLRSIRGKICK